MWGALSWEQRLFSGVWGDQGSVIGGYMFLIDLEGVGPSLHCGDLVVTEGLCVCLCVWVWVCLHPGVCVCVCVSVIPCHFLHIIRL